MSYLNRLQRSYRKIHRQLLRSYSQYHRDTYLQPILSPPPPPPPPSKEKDKMAKPRLVVYHQTHYLPDGTFVSILPAIRQQTGITHVILAAIHLNDEPGDITLNDDPPAAPKHEKVWAEVRTLRENGIPVLAMLGGAAKGTYARLSGAQADFEKFYGPLRDFLKSHPIDGIDLDVEEPMLHEDIVRLVKRIRADFGTEFIITMAPVAPALTDDGNRHLSGFDYQMVQMEVGEDISWYNVQFYCGWGNLADDWDLARILTLGWDPHSIVVGAVTNPANGAGFVPAGHLKNVVAQVRSQYGIGGVMGWEWFNAFAEDHEAGIVRRQEGVTGTRAGGSTLPAPAVVEDEGVQWRWARCMAVALGLVADTNQN